MVIMQTTYARIVDGVAVDVTTTDPTIGFHPSLAAEFVEVPADTLNGATFDGTAWTPPAEVVPGEITSSLSLEPIDFYLAFKPEERRAIKASTDPVIVELWDTYERCERTNRRIVPSAPSVRDSLLYLVSAGILASLDRIAEISLGVPQ